MEIINFKEQAEFMQNSMNFNIYPDNFKMAIPDAKNVLWRGIQHFCGDSAKWNPEYDEIAGWLADNKGRGLLCFGSCGRGKTLICAKILPLILNHYCRKILRIFDAKEMNSKTDEVLSRWFTVIDDLGTESISVKFGEKRIIFSELCDMAEKKGYFLVVTTNLSIDELREKYGERTIDRLRVITKPVLFSGESLRK